MLWQLQVLLVGNKVHILIDENHPALDYVPGEIFETEIEGRIYEMYSEYTPTSMIRLPLNEVKDVIDLENMKTMGLVFDQKDSGALMIDKILVER